MPGRDITGQKSRRAAKFFLTGVIWAGTAVAVLSHPFATAGSNTSQLHRQTFRSQSTQSQTPQSQSGAAPAPPASSSQQPVPNENGTFVIRKDVDEVLLHATVADEKQHIVTDLDKTAFTVFDEGKAGESESGSAQPGAVEQSAGRSVRGELQR